jgi:hypothetical protein
MSQTNYTPQRYIVLDDAKGPDNIGTPILAADFKTAIVDIEQTLANGTLVVYVSDQYYAPDVSQPAGPDNDYHAVGYSDTRQGVFYSAASPYNPAVSTPGGDGRFNIETTGARWIIPCFLDLSIGTVDKLTLNLYDNQ